MIVLIIIIANSSFICASLPLLFISPSLECYDTSQQLFFSCSEVIACSGDFSYRYKDLTMMDTSITGSFNLLCGRSIFKFYCYIIFWFGGCLGSLFFAEIMETKGRLTSLIIGNTIMGFSCIFCSLMDNIILFAFGLFLINFSFRGIF